MVDLPTDAEPVKVVEGDCARGPAPVLPTLAADSFDSIATDPPYELGFMGADWDRTGVAFDVETWKACLRVLKPGGYMVAMGGTRTHHRLMVAIEDAGFEIRDCIMWLYGSGFPKGKGCLKPAWEPIVLARKPGDRVLPLGIDACRAPTDENTSRTIRGGGTNTDQYRTGRGVGATGGNAAGRYPANCVHDGSDEVLEAFAAFGERKVSGSAKNGRPSKSTSDGDRMVYGMGLGRQGALHNDTGTAARFFYCAKASRKERGEGNTHNTVKPLALMRWLVRLVTPPGGLVLDPFAGSGTTLLAAKGEGMRALGIEQDAGHCGIIRKRLAEMPSLGLFAEEGVA